MALTVRQAVEAFRQEHPEADALDRLLAGSSHAPGASPTRANPAFPRKGAAGSAIGDVWIYELGPDDLDEWLGEHPEDRPAAVAFAEWLWRGGLISADRYEDLREALGLPPDEDVRLRRLEARLLGVALREGQHLQEHLLNPVLYLGLEAPAAAEPPAPDLEGELEVTGTAGDRLQGTVGDVAVELQVGADVAALARPGDRVRVALGRAEGAWRLLDASPAGW